jgi:hypothetical protein
MCCACAAVGSGGLWSRLGDGGCAKRGERRERHGDDHDGRARRAGCRVGARGRAGGQRRRCLLQPALAYCSPWLDGRGLGSRAGRARWLFVAESDEIDRYLWRGVAGVGVRAVIVRGLPDLDPRGDDVHRVKSLVVGPDHRIYVNIGSAFNASTLDIEGNPPRASVVSYAPNGADARVIATGVRNGEGLSFAPDGVLWSAVNERDQIPYPFHRPDGGLADAYGQVIQAYVNELRRTRSSR